MFDFYSIIRNVLSVLCRSHANFAFEARRARGKWEVRILYSYNKTRERGICAFIAHMRCAVRIGGINTRQNKQID